MIVAAHRSRPRSRSGGAARRPRVARRRGRSRVNWDRLGRVALTIVLAAVFASYLNPALNLLHAWRDSRASEERLVELKRENRELERRATEAATSVVLEREARRLGYVRPGERAYVIKDLPE